MERYKHKIALAIISRNMFYVFRPFCLATKIHVPAVSVESVLQTHESIFRTLIYATIGNSLNAQRHRRILILRI
jgi:hypothetical protein